jgi:hypothetical protein
MVTAMVMDTMAILVATATVTGTVVIEVQDVIGDKTESQGGRPLTC